MKDNTKKNAGIAVILIFLLLAGSIAAIYIMNIGSGDAEYAYIYQNGELIRTIDLTAVNEPYTFTVTGEDGSYNIIEARNGSIGVIDADCPDKLCMNMGFIESSVIPVTCLPHHLVIELSRENKENPDEPDGIVY